MNLAKQFISIMYAHVEFMIMTPLETNRVQTKIVGLTLVPAKQIEEISCYRS